MIWWVRHGESTWNAAGLHQGSNRLPPLTARGGQQAEEAGRILAGHGVTQVWSSPAVRALQTAAVIGRWCGVAVAVEPALIECDREEAVSTVASRLRAFVQLHGRSDRVVVAVSHGETIRVAVELLGGRSIRLPPNGAVLPPGGPETTEAHRWPGSASTPVCDTLEGPPVAGAGAGRSEEAQWSAT